MSVDPTVKRLPRAVREQQMLDAAVRIFSRLGYHAASMDEIAETAGISKPMVYAYLGTKEELFIACLHREGARLTEAVFAVLSDDMPPERQLRRAIEEFLQFVVNHRDGWSVLHRQARGQEPFAGEIAEIRRSWIGHLTTVLARITPDVADVTPGAYALAGAVESLADWIVEFPDRHVGRDPDLTAARLTDLILNGLPRQ
jgi:AcrR family transcriptional regulator